jgi:hypothetical protein
MSKWNSPARKLALLAVLAACVPISYGQTAPPTTEKSAPAAKEQAVVVTMTECEGINNCATWTFLGASGNGQWPTGEVANLTVERYDKDSVVIKRADSTGAKAGLTAVYTGTRHGDRVGGDYTSSWPGHWENQSGNWYAQVDRDPLPPQVMHFCAVNCFTLKLEQGRFVARNDAGVIFTTWTIESFTRESVILRRNDTNGFGGVIAGQVAREGGKLANQTFNGQPDGAQIVWGPLLNTVPGSNAERDRLRGHPQPPPQVIMRPAVVCVPWFFTIVCGQ